ncbi:DUF488 family protein [Patescibacteria group bacterium]|nr:DUF488 family protein [Patescibacteria group bacterium]
MRRIKPEFKFDIWMPNLAPSTKLLSSYHDKKITWEEFEKKFNKEVLEKQKKYLEIVLDIAQKNTVTLLCWEKLAEKCHRKLVAEKIAELNKNITAIIQ